MADQFRDQVNSARRQGVSDVDIVEYLKGSDPRISEALQANITPKEILDYLAPPTTMVEETARKVGIAGRGMSEAMVGPTAGALVGGTFGGPLGAGVGALAGGLAVPAADILVSGYNRLADANLRTPSEIISGWLPGPRPQTPGERVLQTSAGALGAVGGGVGGGRMIAETARMAPTGAVAPGLEAIGVESARRPIGQLITAPIAAGAGQVTTEVTGNPFYGIGATIATSGALGLRAPKRQDVPSEKALFERSKANYDILDKSGFQMFRKEFNKDMTDVVDNLRAEGYMRGSRSKPLVDDAVDQLLADRPKDVVELTTLRTWISNAAKSTDPDERRIGNILLDKYDDYLLSAPNRALMVRDPEAMKAWTAARADYAKVKKGEIITDILDKAANVQGSKESSIANQLTQLANNPKRMRFFSPEEQDAIREAARGGTVQSMLRTIAKFTPMTPAAAIFTAVSPFGAYTAAAGYAGKQAAEARRVRQVNQLAEEMRLGAKPQIIEGRLANVPIFMGAGARGAQNMLTSQDILNQLVSGNQ